MYERVLAMTFILFTTKLKKKNVEIKLVIIVKVTLFTLYQNDDVFLGQKGQFFWKKKDQFLVSPPLAYIVQRYHSCTAFVHKNFRIATGQNPTLTNLPYYVSH